MYMYLIIAMNFKVCLKIDEKLMAKSTGHLYNAFNNKRVHSSMIVECATIYKFPISSLRAKLMPSSLEEYVHVYIDTLVFKKQQ